MNEDIDIGAELYDKIHADFLKQLGKERELRSMADVSGYSGQVGRALSRAIAANLSPDVLPDGRLYYNIARSILEPSLRENHELVNSAAEQVQRELDEREGIRIKPVRPEFPTERVNDVISAASAEGIPWEKTLRRVTSPAETITMSFADDFMKANAEKRSRAGFDTFIDRQGGGKCCPWCAKLIGHFKYPDNVPKDVYRRHDNCTCTVTYGTKGGARQDVWSKVTWTVPPAKELHRGAVQGAEKVPHRLTGGGNGGIIGTDTKTLLMQKIANGEISTQLNPEVQNRHFFGTKERQEFLDRGIEKSYFLPDVTLETLQNFLNENVGTGVLHINKKGNIEEIFNFGRDIAYDTKLDRNTPYIKVLYSKKRTHFFPYSPFGGVIE